MPHHHLAMVGYLLTTILVSSSLKGGVQQAFAEKSDKSQVWQKLNPLTGGDTTFRGAVSSHSFSHPPHNLSPLKRADFLIGDSLFQRAWISSPSSLKSSDGLGPLFNARSCQSCHIKDGRGHLPKPGDLGTRSVIVKLGLSAKKENALQPEPTYGLQFHDRGHPSVDPEGHYEIAYFNRFLSMEGHRQVRLKKPQVVFSKLAYGPMDPKTVTSLRVAPPMIGLGLLEALDEKDIATRHDPDDHNQDGISGRLSQIKKESGWRLGRFGWKASKPTLHHQNLGAFFMDMSMTSTLHSYPAGDCTEKQIQCQQLAQEAYREDSSDDISSELAQLILFYTQNLAPPRRNIPQDPKEQQQILAGERLFYESGCESCHRAKYLTSTHHPLPHLRSQEIYVYSDLLLHDMGPDLDDGFSTPHAYSYEWRTPPLWGIGYTQTINPKAGFLHDGRATTLEEAILWHGGEAQRSKELFILLSKDKKEQLLLFLESL